MQTTHARDFSLFAEIPSLRSSLAQASYHLPVQVVVTTAVTVRGPPLERSGPEEAGGWDYWLAGSRSPTWTAAVASTLARLACLGARTRTTTLSPIVSWPSEMTVGTLPCQSRKIVLGPTVNVSLLD